MYKSYHYNNMPQPVITQPAPPVKHEHTPEPECQKTTNNNFLGDLKNDDIILLVVIFVLLIDDCEDKLLLIALGFIFFSGLGE